MTHTFYIKEGDTLPAVEATLLDGDGNTVDLDGATVVFSLGNPGAPHTISGSSLGRRPATVVHAGTGAVEYAWEAGATFITGTLTGEFEVTFADGTVTTYPNSEDEELFVLIEDSV